MELPEEELELLKKQAEKFQFDQLNHLFSLLLKGEEEIAQSTFPRTMLEMTLIRMATLRPIRTLEEIIKRLENLESSEPAAGGEEKESSAIRSRAAGRKRSVREAGGGSDPSPLRKPVQEHREGESKENVLKKGTLGDREISRQKGKKASPPATGVEEAWKALVDFARARNPIIGALF